MYTSILFIHLSINGHVGRFLLLTTVNNAATLGVQLSVQVSASSPLGKYIQKWGGWAIDISFFFFLNIFNIHKSGEDSTSSPR